MIWDEHYKLDVFFKAHPAFGVPSDDPAGHFKLPLEFYQEFSERVMATKQCWAESWTFTKKSALSASLVNLHVVYQTTTT